MSAKLGLYRALLRPLLGAAALTCIGLGLSLVLAYHSLRLDLSPYYERSALLYDKAGHLISYTPAADTRLRFLTRPQEVDPLYLKLLLAAEDERFYAHPGVDLIAAGRALLSNLTGLKRVSGASTLDMQCIRLLERRERTLKNKIIEALKALRLRQALGADGVLQLYLTLAPFGSRLEGVQAGALGWFGHEAQHLTPAEAALLAILPRAPELLRPDRHPKRAALYVRQVLQRAKEQGLIDEKTAAAALNEELPQTLKRIPRPGFYLGQRLFKILPDPDSKPAAPLWPGPVREIKSTLDPLVQSRLTALAQDFNAAHAEDPDLDLAVIVIDDLQGAVCGYLGGRGAQYSELDLTAAVRSPGSALKPFAYALAFERRLLHPLSLMRDDSQGFNLYQPQNFDGRFKGFISAHDALLSSLNVPAVKVLKRLTPALFYAALNREGERLHLPPGAAPSLPIILGGCGITLYDLAALYSALNTGGVLSEPQLVLSKNPDAEDKTAAAAYGKEPPAAAAAADRDDENPGAVRLISERAAALTQQILSDNLPPEGFLGVQGIAYKTGTSYNYADALAAGSRGRYTAAVWVGRRSGQGSYQLTGRSAAAPLLFTVLSQLPENGLPPLGGAAGPSGLTAESKNEPNRSAAAAPRDFNLMDVRSSIGQPRRLTADYWRDHQPELSAPAYLKFFDITEIRQDAAALPMTDAASIKTSTKTSRALLTPALTFIFPRDGMELYAAPGQDILIEGAGGVPPYLLYVNGRLQEKLSFNPHGRPGFYRLTITDSRGAAVSAVIKTL